MFCPVLFIVFSRDISADSAKSNLHFRNCLFRHSSNESKYAEDYYISRSSGNINQLRKKIQWDPNIIMQSCQKYRINSTLQKTQVILSENKNKDAPKLKSQYMDQS